MTFVRTRGGTTLSEDRDEIFRCPCGYRHCHFNVVVAPETAGVEGLGSGKRQRASGDLHGIYQSPQILAQHYSLSSFNFFLPLTNPNPLTAQECLDHCFNILDYSPSQGLLLGFPFWVDPAVRTVSRRRLLSQVQHCLSGQNSERFPSLNTFDVLILNYPETAPRISARYITSLYTSGERLHNRTISQNYLR